MEGEGTMIREIELLPGSDIESTVYTLLAAKARGDSVYAEFNGHKLYSYTVSIDSAYLEITGQSKADFDKAQAKWLHNYIIEQAKARKEATVNIPNWIAKGQQLIHPERHQNWELCVHNRAHGLYHGLDLDYALEIMQAIENGVSIKEAAEMLDEQGHSGMSNSVIRNILLNFSSKGPEFWEATAFNGLTAEEKEVIAEKKAENKRLAELYTQEKPKEKCL